jgi:hypothetical protein
MGFELRTAQYGRNNPYPRPGSLTIAMPFSSSEVSSPRGDAIASGTIDRNGKVNLKLQMPDGARASYTGNIVHNEVLPLHATYISPAQASLIGPVSMVSTRSDRDFDGRLRYYSPGGFFRGQFMPGFNQSRTVLGSRYAPPSKGFLPVSDFLMTQFNTRFNYVGGDFGGIAKIGTWDASNRITIPASPIDNAKASFNAKTGIMSIQYTLTDATRDLFKSRADGFAVALQRPAQISGFYTSAFSNGLLSVVPNDGTTPELTLIDPRKKTVSAALSVYQVQVDTPGEWQILLPASDDWVSATIVAGADPDAPVDPENPTLVLRGFGRGVVEVTVGANATQTVRKTFIEIAGINHEITQDFRF